MRKFAPLHSRVFINDHIAPLPHSNTLITNNRDDDSYKASQPDELSFNEGDKVEILEKVDSNWWKGKIGFKQGLVPASYLQEES